MMTKEEKIKLKEMLPPKWVSLIVNGTGLSGSYIRKVLSGDRSNLLIEEEALKLAKEYQAKASKIEQLKKVDFMNVQKLPAGICDQGVEIFRDNEGRVFFLQNGNKLPYLMLDSESREYFQADLAADKTALAVLKKEFGLVEAEEQEEMFVGCRYGNLDYRADLIEGKLMPDAPRCALISTCPGFNVICRIPLAPRGALTRSEYRIVILISLGKQAKEISEILGITDSTTRTHIQRIHNKLGVNNNIEVASWAHEHRIV